MKRLAPFLTAVALAIHATVPGRAGEIPSAGLFHIVSGTYEVHGGIFGILSLRLPTPQHAWVLLQTVGDGDTADLTILAEDGQTVQRTLTNGVVSGASIRFQSQRPHPQFLGVVEETDYVVTLANSALTLNGASQLRPPPCCDIPNYFVYTNVVAVPMPELAIRVSEVELCWPARDGFRYQLQSCPDLVIGAWANVGPPLSGSGGVLCVTAKVLADAPPTFYRIVPGLGR